jgi:hypothetical protein
MAGLPQDGAETVGVGVVEGKWERYGLGPE